MTIQRFAVSGGSLAYRDVGEGEPTLLVHGMTGSMRNWARVAQTLARTCRVLSYDQRGHGCSDPIAGPCSLEDLAEDLSTFLDHVGVEHPAVVAHSMGSMVAQQFVLSHPKRVRRLVLVGSTAAPLTDDERRWLAAGIEAAATAGIAGAWETHQRLLTDWQRRSMVADPELAAVVRREFEGTAPEGYIAFARTALHRVDLRSRLGEVRCPTLVVVGEHDTARLPTTSEIAALVPGASRVVLRGAGHTPMLEAPEAFLSVVAGFLAEP